MQKTIIIIPCYNESKRLKTISFSNYLESNPSITLLFVDDGSDDSTLSILQKLSKKHVNALCLSLQKNSGKAEAIRQGVIYISDNLDCELFGYFDADLSTSLNYIKQFQEVFKGSGEIKIVMGARIRRLGAHISRNQIRHIFGRIVATIASIILALPVYDTQCGAKIFDHKFVGQVFLEPFQTKWLFDIEILLRLTQKYGCNKIIQSTLEFPLERWIDEGNSKIKFKDFLFVPYYLLKIIFKYKK